LIGDIFLRIRPVFQNLFQLRLRDNFALAFLAVVFALDRALQSLRNSAACHREALVGFKILRLRPLSTFCLHMIVWFVVR
jgi:hypothetical protein